MFGLLFLIGCSSSQTFLDPGFANSGGQHYKRIVLVLEPGELDRAAHALLLGTSLEYIGHHKEYILYGAGVERAERRGAGFCAGGDYEADAYLLLKVERATLEGARFLFSVKAGLHDCADDSKLWAAEYGSAYPRYDQDLAATIRGFQNRYGVQTGPFIPGVYLITRELFESLPDPELSGDDILEKIDIDARGPRLDL